MQRGFTLIEALVAVTVLGIAGMLSYGTFANAVDARERSQAVTNRYHQVRQAMVRMSTEIGSAFISYYRNCDDPQNKTIFLGKRSSHGDRLDFTSFSNHKMMADANQSDQTELSYYVDYDPDDRSQKVLYRRSQAPIDNEPEEGGRDQVLAEGVEKIEFEFYDSKNDEWEDEWDSTNLETRFRLPLFVSIKMKYLNPAGEDEEVTTKTRLFMREPLVNVGVPQIICDD